MGHVSGSHYLHNDLLATALPLLFDVIGHQRLQGSEVGGRKPAKMQSVSEKLILGESEHAVLVAFRPNWSGSYGYVLYILLHLFSFFHRSDDDSPSYPFLKCIPVVN